MFVVIYCQRCNDRGEYKVSTQAGNSNTPYTYQKVTTHEDIKPVDINEPQSILEMDSVSTMNGAVISSDSTVRTVTEEVITPDSTVKRVTKEVISPDSTVRTVIEEVISPDSTVRTVTKEVKSPDSIFILTEDIKWDSGTIRKRKNRRKKNSKQIL